MEGKILVGCRDADCRNLLSEIFSQQGVYLNSVLDETDFLLEILERDYQVIIYDLEKSIIDGLKMVRIVRKIRPKVALVVISHDPSKILGGKILQEGVTYYTVKPIHVDAIQQAVVAALNCGSG